MKNTLCTLRLEVGGGGGDFMQSLPSFLTPFVVTCTLMP